MRLPDGLGMELLQRIQQDRRSERCVVMTAYGSAENAVEALKAGAFDYLTKPVDLKQFRTVVASAVQQAQRGGASAAQAAPGGAVTASATAPARPCRRTRGAALERLVGDSQAMQWVKSRIAKVARGMAPVLVRGESGTGKELVARAVHACSQRSEGPFVAVNCGAIPENLLEAEFFGARKGSYTGSAQDRDGYFQAARGGTLFLDEIGDLPLAMQSKLLRAIQERSVRPIGSTQEDSVDVRIVSATHKDLHAEVQAGRFRQDLFYRLNVIEIPVPPLRERREDLPALCAALLTRIAHDAGMPAPALSAPLLQQLADASAARQRARTREPVAPRGRPGRWRRPATGSGRRSRPDTRPRPRRRDRCRIAPCGGRKAPSAEPARARPATYGGSVRPAALPRPAGARNPGPRAAR